MSGLKKVLYIDMDNVLCDYKKAYASALIKCPQIQYPQSQFEFWRKLEPIEGAVEAVQFLNEKFDVYILSAPSVENPLCYTEKRLWIEDYLEIEMAHKFIISPNKGLNKGDYLIDDYIEGRGQENFEGEIIHFESEKFPGWKEVLVYLQSNN